MLISDTFASNTYRKLIRYRTALPLVGNFFGTNNFSHIEIKDAFALKSHYSNLYSLLCSIDNSYTDNPLFAKMFATIDDENGLIKSFKENLNISQISIDNKAYDCSEDLGNMAASIRFAYETIAKRSLEHNDIHTSNDSVLRLLFCSLAICKEIHSKYSDSYQSLDFVTKTSDAYHLFLYKVIRDGFELEDDLSEFVISLAENFKRISDQTALKLDKINFSQLSNNLINNSKVIINRAIALTYAALTDNKIDNKTSLLMNLYQNNRVFNDMNTLDTRFGYLLQRIADDHYIRSLYGRADSEIEMSDSYGSITDLLEVSDEKMLSMSDWQVDFYDKGNIFTKSNRGILESLFGDFNSSESISIDSSKTDSYIRESLDKIDSGIENALMKRKYKETILTDLYNILDNITYFGAVNYHLDKAHKLSGNMGQAFVYIVLKKQMSSLLYSYTSTLGQLVSNLSGLIDKTSKITKAEDITVKRKSNFTSSMILFSQIREFQDQVSVIVAKIEQGIIKLNTPNAERELVDEVKSYVKDIEDFLSSNEIHNNESLPRLAEYSNPMKPKRVEWTSSKKLFTDDFTSSLSLDAVSQVDVSKPASSIKQYNHSNNTNLTEQNDQEDIEIMQEIVAKSESNKELESNNFDNDLSSNSLDTNHAMLQNQNSNSVTMRKTIARTAPAEENAYIESLNTKHTSYLASSSNLSASVNMRQNISANGPNVNSNNQITHNRYIKNELTSSPADPTQNDIIAKKLNRINTQIKSSSQGLKYFHLCLEQIANNRPLPKANLRDTGLVDETTKEYIHDNLSEIIDLVRSSNSSKQMRLSLTSEINNILGKTQTLTR